MGWHGKDNFFPQEVRLLSNDSAEVLILHDAQMLEHECGPGHPERPDRLRAAEAALRTSGLTNLRWEAPPLVSLEAIVRVHDPSYVERIHALEGETVQLDPDTGLSAGSVRAARLAAGAGVRLVEAIASGEVSKGFALVRPPGHHALADRAMGFCIFGNVAIAAVHAVESLGFERVLIIDWDVHHGNGTEALVYDRPDVLFFSVHQAPFYPGTGRLLDQGEGEGRGFNVNAPLPAGLGDGDYAHVFRKLVMPIADRYRPDLVLVSAGYDAHRQDPIGNMRVTSQGFGALCGMARYIAKRHAQGRLGLLLEGGYDLEGLAGGVLECTKVLAGKLAPGTPKPSVKAIELVDGIRAAHAETWGF
jgi:acetoin utilization deacetylase AcuC-like enzyme